MALTRNCRTPTPPPPPPPPHAEAPAPADSSSRDAAPSKEGCGKSLPVHCVVEAVSTLDDSQCAWRLRPAVETDSYVIIPAGTAFHDLVRVVLQRLGYPRDAASASKGSVIIKNWKPLSFDKIADAPSATVGDILGELTTVATLRIQLYRARPSVLSEIKEKLLRLLISKSHNLLLSSGCPLDEATLSQLCRGAPQPLAEPSEDCRRRFEQWWGAQAAQQPPRPELSPQRASPAKCPERPVGSGTTDPVHPALQTVQSQYPTQKTRMRTSFDPELELPKLQRWFSENQHPSRQQIHHYVKELNGLESRRGRKPLDVNNVVYWFKNARAAQKRAELRSVGPGMGCPLSLNGYSSNSHSPPQPVGLLLGPAHQQHARSPGRGYPPSDTSEPEPADEEPLPARPRDYRDYRDYRDPREELRTSQAADGRYSASPSAPLSLTTGDKEGERASPAPKERSRRQDVADDRTNGNEVADEEPGRSRFPSPEAPLSLALNGKDRPPSPLSQHLPMVDGIKQEPPDTSPSLATANYSNNLTKPDDENVSEMEDDDDEEAEDLDDKQKETMDGEEESGMGAARLEERLRAYRSPSPRGLAGEPPDLERLAAGFPLVPNSMFSHSIMYMSHYIPGLAHQHRGPPASVSGAAPHAGLNLSAALADERRKRNRTFIDPVTEVPRLEQWFALNTHPSHNLILKYTDELNRMPYRQKFPRLEPKNVQFWFKNRRAKCKRLKMSLFEAGGQANHHLQQLPYHRGQSPGGDPLRGGD
ncbi:uncharacterized protein LOC134529059 isoform X2 [Bacillus rossius redtenbacheri]